MSDDNAQQQPRVIQRTAHATAKAPVYYCAVCDQPILGDDIERRHTTPTGEDCHNDCCALCDVEQEGAQ